MAKKITLLALAFIVVLGLFTAMPVTARAANHEFIIVDGTGISAGGAGSNEYSWDKIGTIYYSFAPAADTLNYAINQLVSSETVTVTINAATNPESAASFDFGNKVTTLIGDPARTYKFSIFTNTDLTLKDIKIDQVSRALWIMGSSDVTSKLTIIGECELKSTTSQGAGSALYVTFSNLVINDGGGAGPNTLLLAGGEEPIFIGNANNPRGTRTLTVNANVAAVNDGGFRDRVLFMYCDTLTIGGTGSLELTSLDPNGSGIYVQNVYQNATLNINGPLDLRIKGVKHGIYFLNREFSPTVNFNFYTDIDIAGGGSGHGIYSSGTGTLTVNNNGTGEVTLVGGTYGGAGIYAEGSYTTGGTGDIYTVDSAVITIKQSDTVAGIKAAIQAELDDPANDMVFVYGEKTGVDDTMTINIPNGKTLVWEADYAANTAFNGNLLNLTGGGDFELNALGAADGFISAAGGYAINSSGPGVDIKKGGLFAFGADRSDVINVAPTVSGGGFVLAWNKANGITSYYNTTNKDLVIYPAGYSARWTMNSGGDYVWISGPGYSASYKTPGVTVILMPAPNIRIDYVNERLTGFTPGTHYQLFNSSSYTTGLDGTLQIPSDKFGTTQHISERAQDNQATAISEEQTLIIPARPAAPMGVGKTDESGAGAKNGALTGVSAAMEYKLISASQWTSCGGATVSGLAPGTYQVRYKAVVNTSFASEAATVTVGPGSAATYSFNSPAPVTVNGLTGTVSFDVASPQQAGKVVEAFIEFNGTTSAAGSYNFRLTSAKTGLVYEDTWRIDAGEQVNGWEVEDFVCFTMLSENVGDLTFTLTFTPGATEYFVFYRLSANGTDGSVTTTQLTLDVSTTSLTAGDITVVGATKGALTSTGASTGGGAYLYTLDISSITVGNGGTVIVAINKMDYDHVLNTKVWVKAPVIVGGATAHIVSFNSNGGGAVASQSVNSGGKAAKPADPAKDGWFFGGWYSDAALTTAYDFNKSVTASLTLYAKWKLPFTDAAENAWHYKAVEYVYGKGLMIGTAADKFSPDDTLTRAMIVTILYRNAGEPGVSGLSNSFSDVAEGQWYTNAVKWAAANGIVEGYGNGMFGTEDPVTKEQLAAFIFRTQQATVKIPPNAAGKTFTDLDKVSDWAADEVNTLNAQGIFNDIPGSVFSPQTPATRAEAASMLYRYLSAIGK